MIKQTKSTPPIIYHFDFRQIIFLNVRNGDENQRNDVSGRLKNQNKCNSFIKILFQILTEVLPISDFHLVLLDHVLMVFHELLLQLKFQVQFQLFPRK
jgi:hypothetical protein